MTAFDSCLVSILRHEGGYVNNPRDPGRMTNLGVTRRVWEAWTGKPASEADMRALTPAKVAPLYRTNYWNAVHGDSLPLPLALCVFDFGVNAGVRRAGKFLQRMIGAVPDGSIGPATLAATTAWLAEYGVARSIRDYQQARRDYYRTLPTFVTFGDGWLRRVDEVEAEALRLLP